MAHSRQSELVELQRTLYNSKNPTRRWLHCARRDLIIAAIKKFTTKDSRQIALEIGPGSGVYLPVLLELFEKVVASDIALDYLDYLEPFKTKNSNLTLVVDDITRSHLAEASFDLIVFSEVVEHIAEPEMAIRQIYKLLKPGGILILSTPQKWSPLEVFSKIAYLPVIIDLVRVIYGEPILKAGHIHLMTAKEVVYLLKKTGFLLHECSKGGVYLPLIAEFTGERGLILAQFLEKRLKKGFFDWLLWTQVYIVEKPLKTISNHS